MQQARRPRSFRNLFASEREMLAMFSADIGEEEYLSADEEVRLWKRVKAGDAEAKEHFVKTFLPMVIHLAHKFAQCVMSIPLTEFVAAGNIGLLETFKKFDPAKGRFSTYSTAWIKQEMYALCRIFSGFKYSDTISRERRQFNESRRRLLKMLGSEPSLMEIAKDLKIPISKSAKLDGLNKGICFEAVLKKILAKNSRSADFSNRDEELEGANPFEKIPINSTPVPDEADKVLLRDLVREVMDELPLQERLVIMLRFGLLNGEVYSMPQIGRILNVSKQRIFQLLQKALKILNRNDRLEAEHALRRAL